MAPADLRSLGSSILYVFCALFNIALGGLHWFRISLRHTYTLAFRIISRPVYNFRYFSKYLRRNRAKKTTELGAFHETLSGSTRKSPLPIVLSTESHNQQVGILGNYDVLMLVIRNLHHVDLFNLSLASKSLRQLLFSTSDFATRSAALQVYTCSEGTKSQCWVCDTQICSVRVYPGLLIQ